MRQFVIDTIKARNPNQAVDATPEEMAKIRERVATMKAEEAARQARIRATSPPEGGSEDG